LLRSYRRFIKVLEISIIVILLLFFCGSCRCRLGLSLCEVIEISKIVIIIVSFSSYLLSLGCGRLFKVAKVAEVIFTSIFFLSS